MRLFKYNFKKWFNLNWAEVQEILAYAVSEKSVEELEEKQAVIQTQLQMVASRDPVFAEGDHTRNLSTVNNILGAAIVSKKFD